MKQTPKRFQIERPPRAKRYEAGEYDHLLRETAERPEHIDMIEWRPGESLVEAAARLGSRPVPAEFGSRIKIVHPDYDYMVLIDDLYVALKKTGQFLWVCDFNPNSTHKRDGIQLPEALGGMFTESDLVFQAVRKYRANHNS